MDNAGLKYTNAKEFTVKVWTGLEQCDNRAKANTYLLETVCPALNNVSLEELPSIEIRNHTVNEITEKYFELFNKFPSSYILEVLGNYLLLDYIKDKTKTKNDELQFLTPTQEKRRYQKEFTAVEDTMDFLNSKYVVRMDSLKKKETVEKKEN